MLDTILYILLAIGLIYSYFVLGKWHRLAKKCDAVTDGISKELNREVGCIISNSIFSPQNFLELMTKECFIIHTSKPVIQQIEDILDEYEIPSISYDLADVHLALSAGVPIVLVDCCDTDENLQPIKVIAGSKSLKQSTKKSHKSINPNTLPVSVRMQAVCVFICVFEICICSILS